MHWPTFQFKRIQLKPITVKDKALYVELMTDENIMKFSKLLNSVEKTRESFDYVLSQMSSESCLLVYWQIYSTIKKRSCGFATMILNEDRTEANIGIVAKDDRFSKAMAVESLPLLANAILTNKIAKTVVSNCHKEHSAVLRLLPKSGFRFSHETKTEDDHQQYWMFDPSLNFKRNN